MKFNATNKPLPPPTLAQSKQGVPPCLLNLLRTPPRLDCVGVFDHDILTCPHRARSAIVLDPARVPRCADTTLGFYRLMEIKSPLYTDTSENSRSRKKNYLPWLLVLPGAT
jgi:hypothetical protein